AKKGSGMAGDAVTNGLKLATGLAVGAAGLGIAAAGRGTVGAFMKGASTGDTAARRLAAGDPSLGKFGRFQGRLQTWTGIDKLQQKVGTRINADQHEVDHA